MRLSVDLARGRHWFLLPDLLFAVVARSGLEVSEPRLTKFVADVWGFPTKPFLKISLTEELMNALATDGYVCRQTMGSRLEFRDTEVERQADPSGFHPGAIWNFGPVTRASEFQLGFWPVVNLRDFAAGAKLIPFVADGEAAPFSLVANERLFNRLMIYGGEATRGLVTVKREYSWAELNFPPLTRYADDYFEQARKISQIGFKRVELPDCFSPSPDCPLGLPWRETIFLPSATVELILAWWQVSWFQSENRFY